MGVCGCKGFLENAKKGVPLILRLFEGVLCGKVGFGGSFGKRLFLPRPLLKGRS